MSEARRGPGFGTRPGSTEPREERNPPDLGEVGDSGFGNTASNRPTPLDLDAAIDAVAREMTEAEPTGALRARVLDEIARKPRRPGFALPRWAWAGAAAAVVLATASAVWMATRPADERSAAVQVAESRPAPRDTAPALQPGPVAAVPEPRKAAVARTAVLRTAKAPDEADDDEGHRLPALAEIEPLRFTAVGPAALQVDGVEVAPLAAMSTIEIPSLDMGSNDPRSADPKKEQ